jgi:hypothetical protein
MRRSLGLGVLAVADFNQLRRVVVGGFERVHPRFGVRPWLGLAHRLTRHRLGDLRGRRYGRRRCFVGCRRARRLMSASRAPLTRARPASGSLRQNAPRGVFLDDAKGVKSLANHAPTISSSGRSRNHLRTSLERSWTLAGEKMPVLDA